MANVILVLGKTSSGKSTSMENLDPNKTYLINCLGKRLPFKGGMKHYTAENKNIKNTKDYQTVIKVLNAIPAQKPEIDSIIIDDARHIMEDEFVRRAAEVGYTKFTEIGKHMIMVMETAKQLPDNIDVFIILHTDEVLNEQKIIEYRAKLVGKLVGEHFDPLEIATMAFFTYVKMTNGKPEYYFVTNRREFEGITYPAKSPPEMLEALIPNDLKLVKDSINKYYKED